jgi:hypothetical protein
MKRVFSVFIIFSLAIFTIINYNISNNIKVLEYPEFIAQDRPFGENLVSLPTRNCVAMLNSLDLSLIIEEKRDEISNYSSEEICRLGNMESFITFGDLDGDFLSEVMFLDKRDNYLSDMLSKYVVNNKNKGIFFFMDANNDKLNDIILSPNSNRNELLFISNKGERRFEVESPVSYKGEEMIEQVPTNVTTDDINKDGLADIIFTISGNENYPARIFISNIDKDISYNEVTSNLFLGNYDAKDLNIFNNTTLVNDFNLDGKLDLFIAGLYSSNFYISKDNKFILDKSNSFEEGLIGASLSDYNKDGLLDIIATDNSSESKGLVILLANKNNNFMKIRSIYNKSLESATGFINMDFNMDGYNDFFIGNKVLDYKNIRYEERNHLRPYILLGDENSLIDETGEVFRSLLMIEAVSNIASTDFNGDFKPDILLAGNEMAKPHMILNSSKGNNKAAAILIKGKGVGGSPLNGEGAIITIKIKDRPVQKFKLPSKISNYNSYSATAPIIIGLGESEEALIDVLFPSGINIKGKIFKDKINIIKEAE